MDPAGDVEDRPSRLGASQAAFEIRAYKPEDEPQVLDLLQAAFGGWPSEVEAQRPAELFRWKHMESPFGPSILLVAEASGAVIGFQAWLRWRLRAAGRTFHGLRAVDLAVDAEHRRRGVYAALIRAGMQHFPEETAFTLSNPNPRSRPAAIKSGLSEIGQFPLFLRVRSPIRLGMSLIDERRREDAREPSPAVEAEPAAEALLDGDAVGSLLAEAEEPEARLRTVKDLDYLRWRYGSLSLYRAVRVQRGGRLAGMAIFRVRRRGPRLVLTICELLVAGSDRRLARQLLRQVVNASPADFLICHFPSRSTQRQAAVQCGFLHLPRGPVPTIRLLSTDMVPDPTRQASWALCLGDLDLL
ncbi:MAG: GNAT family N-acetyltransferase [Solirubrobacteraceae bacterium]